MGSRSRTKATLPFSPFTSALQVNERLIKRIQVNPEEMMVTSVETGSILGVWA